MYIKYNTLTLYYFVSSRVATSLRFSRRYIPPLKRRDSAPLGQSRQIIPRIGEDDRAERNTGAAAEVCNEARCGWCSQGETYLLPLKRYSWSLTNSRDGTPPRIHPLTAAPST